jgi:hypothetical protein
MPARASFLTERYVRDHGVYTNWAEAPSDMPTYLHALQGAGYYTVALGKQHLTRDEELDVAHQDDLAPSLHARGFAEVQESGDKFSLTVPNRYSDYLRSRGLWDAYLQHLTDRSYQGERETGRAATKKVPMWDATPTPLPLDDYIDSWHGRLAVDWIGSYDRVRGRPRSARSVGRAGRSGRAVRERGDAGVAAVDEASRSRRHWQLREAPQRVRPALGYRHDDRRRDSRDATRVRGERLGDRP